MSVLSMEDQIRLVDLFEDQVRVGRMTVKQFERFLLQHDLVPSDDESESDDDDARLAKRYDDAVITESEW